MADNKAPSVSKNVEEAVININTSTKTDSNAHKQTQTKDNSNDAVFIGSES